MEQFKYVWIGGGADYAAAKAVRTAVFVTEQGYSIADEFDAHDKTCEHLVIYDGDKPVAAARLFIMDGTKTAKLGRICVLKEYRGCHLGARLMEGLIARAGALGAKDMYISAQTHAVPFYEKFGFKPYGNSYKDGHIPHVDMKAAV